MTMKLCPHCGVEFEPSGNNWKRQMCCSRRCGSLFALRSVHIRQRKAVAAKTDTCQECGKVFIRGNRARAKTCSPTCAQQMRLGEWWKAKNKPQAACAPCLYRVGYGVKRMQKTLRISTPLNHVRNAGLVVQSTPERRAMATRLGNRTKAERCKPAGDAKARLKADLRLLRQVIGEMRRELISRPKEVEKRRLAANAATLARYHRTKPQGLRFKSPKAKTDEERRNRARNYVKMWSKNNPEKAKSIRRKAHKKQRKTFAAKQRNALNKAIKTKHASKLAKSSVLWGCNAHFLQGWIESQFTRGMSWKNRSEWHIDHIVPCAAFDLSTLDGQRSCFHYTNLRPLWASENIAKSDTIITCQPELLIAINGSKTEHLGKKGIFLSRKIVPGIDLCEGFL